MPVLHEPGVQVARHAVVRAGIRAVGRDVHLQHVVALHVVVILGKRARLHVIGQHDNALVAGSDADFVFGTNHAVRFHAPEFRFLYGETLVSVIQLGAQGSYHHLLPCGYVRRPAYNLHGVALPQVDRRNVHVVGIGMRLAGQHFSDDQAFQPSFNRLDFFHFACFQPDRGKRRRHLFGGQVEVDVFF